MVTVSLDKPLTNFQVELLKLFARDLPEKNLRDLKEMISDYLLEMAREEADKVWEKKEYTKQNADDWLHKNPIK